MTDHDPTDAVLPPPSGAQPPKRKRPFRLLPWVIVAGLAGAAGGSYWWWKSGAGDAAGAGPGQAASAPGGGGPGGPGGPGARRRFGGGNAVQPVSVQPARQQSIRVNVNAIGSIAASNTAVVRPQASGVLQQLSFKEGQQVRVGQVLAQIDPRAFQAALGQAEGAMARDKAQLEAARVDLARYRDLMAKDAIARQQLDTQAALVAQLEGALKADQANVDNARLQLSYTRVTAPIAGRVGLKQVDIGNVVQPGDANGIVVITQTQPIAMVFSVPSAHVPMLTQRLRAGAAVQVEAWDRSAKQPLATGRVETVDNAIDASTDTIKVKALFPNADEALFPNQAVSVVLQLDTLTDVLAVPQAAVLRGSQGFYVYVVNADKTVSTRVVKPGAVDAGWMAVEGALQPDESVVIDGTDRLREGARVEVIAADPLQRAGASAPAPGSRRGPRGAGGAPGGPPRSPAGALPAVPAASSASSPRTEHALPRPEAAASSASGPGGERPRWMDRVSPEQAEKLKAMTPEERRAWFRQQREAEGQRGGNAPAQ